MLKEKVLGAKRPRDPRRFRGQPLRKVQKADKETPKELKNNHRHPPGGRADGRMPARVDFGRASNPATSLDAPGFQVEGCGPAGSATTPDQPTHIYAARRAKTEEMDFGSPQDPPQLQVRLAAAQAMNQSTPPPTTGGAAPANTPTTSTMDEDEECSEEGSFFKKSSNIQQVSI